jgi:hypothetical protein
MLREVGQFVLVLGITQGTQLTFARTYLLKVIDIGAI